MQSIDIGRELGETPDLLFTVNEENLSQLKPLSEFARALGLMLVVNPVFSYSKFCAPDIELFHKLDQYRSSPFVYINSAFHKLRSNGGNQIKSPRCRVVNSTIVISPDNKLILPCYHFQQQQLDIDSMPTKTQNRRTHSQLAKTRNSEAWNYFQHRQGRFDFCQGCHLNCYFDPSFLYKMDDYFWTSILEKSRYWWRKNILRRLLLHKFDSRPAIDIAQSIMTKYDANF